MTSPIPTDLVPCPFCGDSATVSYWGREAQILCTNCNALSAAFDGADAEKRAAEAWNTRAATGVEHLQSQLTAAPERLRDVFTFLYQEGLLDGLREARGKPQTGKDAAIEQAMGFARAALKTMEQGE